MGHTLEHQQEADKMYSSQGFQGSAKEANGHAKRGGKKHQRRNSLGRATNTQEFMLNGASAISSMGSMGSMGSAKSMNGAHGHNGSNGHYGSNGHNGSNGENGMKAASTMSKNTSMGMSEGDQWKDKSQVQVYESVEEAQRPGISANQGVNGQGGEALEGMRDLEQEFKEADEKMEQLRQTMSSASLKSTESTRGYQAGQEEQTGEQAASEQEKEGEEKDQEEEVQLRVYDRMFGDQEFETEDLVIRPVNYDVMIMATKLFPEPVARPKA